MEVESAFRRALLASSAVTGYVQQAVWKFRLEDHVDGQGTRAVVLYRDGGWAAPNDMNTPEFPLLTVECWADCTRNHVAGRATEKAAEDAIDNAYALYRVVDAVLHPMPRGLRWGAVGSDPGLLVVGGQRWSEPSHYDATRGDGFGRQFGEAAMVRATYALQVSHGRD